MFLQFTGNRHTRKKLVGKFFAGDNCAIVIIAGIEDLESKIILFQT
jgi:hypothetical protein